MDIQQDMQRYSRSESPKRVIVAPVRVTEEDKQALATWMLDNPVITNLKTYFSAFKKHVSNHTVGNLSPDCSSSVYRW